MIIDYVRLINAAKKFKIKDDFEFISLDDVSSEHIEEHKSVPELLEIWAAVRVFYEGEMPDSYKSLNLIIGDWVNNNIESLTDVLHKELQEHFGTFYENSSIDDLNDVEGTAIWKDQLDYMPIMDEKENSIIIEIELVLHAEEKD